VQWLLLDRRLLDQQGTQLLQELLHDQFTVRFEQSDIVLAQRTKAAPKRLEQPAQFACSAP
jgi:hypothetical protein